MLAIGGQASVAGDAPAAVAPLVFVCEHGSVKSLIAASLFNRAASQRGMPFRAISRGVAPDERVPPGIATALAGEGFDVADFRPTHLSATDIAQALRIVAIGVDVSSSVPAATASIEHWDDVPAASVDYAAAHRSLEQHVDRLLDELSESH